MHQPDQKKRIFSGLKPSGAIHLGNYLGALKNWVALQDQGECIYSIVNLHAITVPQKPAELARHTLEVAASYLALGINPDTSILFVQSQVPEHTELAWILGTITKLSELKLMHQFKEQSKASPASLNAALFSYPVLMAADILLYHTNLVPVGEDQVQHIELAREIARRFNATFGNTFPIPEGMVPTHGARIMGLDNPLKKMTKGAQTEYNYIAFTDTPEEVTKKISRAVTDSGSDIVFHADKPAISNLLTIYQALDGRSIKELEKKYIGKSYKEFKRDLTEVTIAFLAPVQKKYKKLLADERGLLSILGTGAARAKKIAQETMSEVRTKVGLL